MNKFLSPSPIWQNAGLFLVRIIIGAFLIYHGKEVFDAVKMKEYAGWANFKSSSYMPYLGKGAEFVAGVLLMLGLFTRVAALIIIGTFTYIAFFIGHGKIWYEDQYPLLFAMLGLMFSFTGPGALSLDGMFFKTKKNSY
jgi:putative oxidoreductase